MLSSLFGLLNHSHHTQPRCWPPTLHRRKNKFPCLVLLLPVSSAHDASNSGTPYLAFVPTTFGAAT